METQKGRPRSRYEFSSTTPPKRVVAEGESFVAETEDSLGGAVGSRTSVTEALGIPGREAYPVLANPLSGPYFVEGAERGDVLAVSVEDIVVGEEGCLVVFPEAVPSAFAIRWPHLQNPRIFRFAHVRGPGDDSGEIVRCSNGSYWPIQPMIGTIGVAPERETPSSVWGQGPWGGNLDCSDLRKGCVILLNCYHTGGLLYVGDVHGSQGDTELLGGADETRAQVRLSCKVMKNKRVPFPRVITEDSLIALCSSRPLEEAALGALQNLTEWLTDEFRYDPADVLLHASADPRFRLRVYQMVKAGTLGYTVGACLTKEAIRQEQE